VSHVDILAHSLETSSAANVGVDSFVIDSGSQLSMGEKIGVTTNGRGEMGIDLGSETVMTELGISLCS
jgi:hypothetical protein